MTRLVRGLADLARGYKVILSDVWGVVHNGRVAFESATEALGRFRVGGGIPVVLDDAQSKPVRGGAARPAWRYAKSYDAIVSSGDVTVSLLVARLARPYFILGRPMNSPFSRRFWL